MKFLECSELEYVNSLFNQVVLEDTVFYGKIECYSCKMVADDRRLARTMDAQLHSSVSAQSPPTSSISPYGPLAEITSRKTFIDLVSLMSASFPDYDFTGLKPDHFVKETSPQLVVNAINTSLAEIASHLARSDLVALLWRSIDQVIAIPDCDMYSYLPDLESGPFSEEGTIWSFNYFFYNRKLKKIVFLAGRRCRKSSDDESDEDGSSSDDMAMDM